MNYLLELLGRRKAIEENGQIWFCGRDVATALDYTNPKKAISDHCKEEGVTIRSLPTNGGIQQAKFINEPNLYRLITHSNSHDAISRHCKGVVKHDTFKDMFKTIGSLYIIERFDWYQVDSNPIVQNIVFRFC